jgi:hypothetical protein
MIDSLTASEVASALTLAVEMKARRESAAFSICSGSDEMKVTASMHPASSLLKEWVDLNGIMPHDCPLNKGAQGCIQTNPRAPAAPESRITVRVRDPVRRFT